MFSYVVGGRTAVIAKEKKFFVVADLATVLFTVASLLFTCCVMSAGASPVVRHRRSAISQLVDMDRLRNPCALSGGGGGSSSGDCALGDPVRLTAKLARDALVELKKHLGLNTCAGMSLDVSIQMPVITESMSNEEKLRVIFKSLVQHVAYIQALSTRDATTAQNFESSLGRLRTLQCSMLCHLGLTAAQVDEVITTAGAIVVDINQDASSHVLHNCLVVDSTLLLLDKLIDVAQG